MKGKLLIVFNSYHGYVKRYVDIIGNALGCDAVPADKVRLDMFVGYDKILYIGSVRDNVVSGLKKFSDYFDAIFRRLIICGVYDKLIVTCTLPFPAPSKDLSSDTE